MAATTAHFILHGDGLPADLLAVRYRAIEAVSVPYEVSVDFATEDSGFALESLLRRQLTLEVVDDSGEARFIDGVVDQCELTDVV